MPARVYGGTLEAGQQVVVMGSGSVNRGIGPNVTADGDGVPCPVTCVASGLSQIALVARVGSGPWQFVGRGPTVITAASAGRLEFAVNDDGHTDNSGAFFATVVRGMGRDAGAGGHRQLGADLQ